MKKLPKSPNQNNSTPELDKKDNISFWITSKENLINSRFDIFLTAKWPNWQLGLFYPNYTVP